MKTALVDGNNFYVSCERVFNPELAGKPVVVLSNSVGLLADTTGSYQPAWLALGIFCLLMTSAIYRTPRWA